MREINVITLKKIRLHTWSEGKKDSTEDAIRRKNTMISCKKEFSEYGP